MWNRVLLKLPIVAIFLITIQSISGGILDSREIEIDFTKTNAANQCEWFPIGRYSITKEGLGWDGPADGEHLSAGEILTKPVGIGLFWRPAQAARIRVEIEPAPLQLSTGDGRKYRLQPGRMFARHSPDLVKWSSWQRLREHTTSTNRIFEGDFGVPGRERLRYELLRVEYGARSDIPWSSDEEAAVRWILQKHPEFFNRNLPFIGYVQLLFEGEFVAGHGFNQMRLQISYSLGGLHQPPPNKDVEAQMWTIPWRFTR